MPRLLAGLVCCASGFETAVHLLKGDVLHVSRQSPAMAEWIGKYAVSVAPRLIRQRHFHFSAGFDRLIVEGVYVFYIEMDPDRSATDALRAESAHLRDFIIKEEYRIADFDRSVHKRAAVRSWDPAQLFRVEGFLIELDSLSRPFHTEVGSNRVGAFRDRVNFRRRHFILRYWVVDCRTRFGFDESTNGSRGFGHRTEKNYTKKRRRRNGEGANGRNGEWAIGNADLISREVAI